MGSAVIVSGFGGQGLLFAGTVLARAAMAEGLEVFWIRRTDRRCAAERPPAPSSWMTSRSGPRSSIAPMSSSPSRDRPWIDTAAGPPGSLLIVDGSQGDADPPFDGVEILAPPCTAMARAAGDDRLVSVVALGALAARPPVVGAGAIRRRA